ncbi:MAG: HAD-IIIA family hydrolase, partial [Desulfobulbaceae bacterium]|nr:HAD-IIIA family hydrolase [Desulfobulbaceae bacterium]
MNKAAVFLDRDGTINEQMGYINHLSRFHLLPGVAEAIRLLNQREIPVIVTTNQSGLARGYFP